MSTKLLLVSALTILAACSEEQEPQTSPITNTAEAADQSQFNPADTEQEWQAKAEARGEAQANSAIRGDAVAEQGRANSANADVGTAEDKIR